MVAGVGFVGRRLETAGQDRADAVARLAHWLLFVVAVDLFVTRALVRLTIFIPKGEPLTTAGAVIGRIGAATDILVPIVGSLLLVALLLRAGRLGGRLEATVLAGLAVVAGGGLALAYAAPTPGIAIALDLLVLAVVIGAAIPVPRAPAVPGLARVGLILLAGAIAAAAIGRLIADSAAFAAPVRSSAGEGVGPMVVALGQIAFVLGAAVVGLAGIRGRSRGRRRIGAAEIGGLIAGLGVLVAGAAAPAMWSILLIWSVGLAGVIPNPAIALAVGLAVAGLPALHRHAPAAAVGASIVLFAGYGLSASGLILAALLGFIAARRPLSGVG